MRHPVAGLLVGAVLLFGAPFASAMRVTWHLSGVVSSVDPDLNSLGVNLDTPFVADITYESSTPESSPGTHADAVISVSFQAAAYSFAFAPTGANRAEGFGNTFQITAGLTPLGLYTPLVQLQLIDTQPSMGPSLPVAPPLYAGTQRTFDIYTGGPTPTAYASGFAIRYSVPEPGDVALLALLGAALIHRRAHDAGAIR